MTIFSKIIAGDIPCSKVYEDDICIAFLDIAPVQKGHTLLVSKEPYTWMTDVPDDTLAHMYRQAKKLIKHMQSRLKCDYVRLYVEGTEVPHFHIHLIPSRYNDKALSLQRISYANEQEKIDILEKIIF